MLKRTFRPYCNDQGQTVIDHKQASFGSPAASGMSFALQCTASLHDLVRIEALLTQQEQQDLQSTAEIKCQSDLCCNLALAMLQALDQLADAQGHCILP